MGILPYRVLHGKTVPAVADPPAPEEIQDKAGVPCTVKA
jgi:hypothetical protein